MILNHQLERMQKGLAMVQFHMKHLADENEESNGSLSENSGCPSEDSNRALLITGEKPHFLS